MSPSRRRDAVARVGGCLGVSERRACRVVGHPRTTQRYRSLERSQESLLTEAVVRLASQFGRYGYRQITALLRQQGWGVNHKRVQRIWRREGLKVPEKQPKRGRLWLNDGSIVRLRPERPNHVWAYDFVAAQTHNGSVLRLLNIIDEYTWECLAIKAERHILAHNVVECLGDLFLEHGVPEHVRSDNDPEFTAKAVRRWIDPVGAKTLFIQPGSPWENGYMESFSGKLRDELLNREVFYTLQEVRVVTDLWRRHCNHYRPHSALGYRPPAPEVISSNTGIPAFATA